MGSPLQPFSNAVIESRRWKAAVAKTTQGVNRDQVLAFFDKDKDKALSALSQMRQAAALRSKTHA